MAKALMLQGTGSNVGKSMLVAGLARAYWRRGLKVAPFKPQNMSNNAAVTQDGGEIGRAQALQARACKIAPHTDMNPVLLKPESATGAQIIVQGKRHAMVEANQYGALREQLMRAVLDSYRRLTRDVDLILIEGAGSPAEVNLRARDIANMGFAQAVSAPVVLIGDIDRGGVIAQLVGTQAVLDAADNALIKGFIVNKFRGDVSLFTDGARDIVRRTGWRDIGTVPWFDPAHLLPAEDVLDIASSAGGPIKIAVPHLSRIANFDDLDPLSAEPDVTIDIVAPGRPLPGDADLVLLAGTKSTVADLAFLRAQGWDIDLNAHVRRGGRVLGICGGYQMLGKSIDDPHGIEGVAGRHEGLGLLDVHTTMQSEKTLKHVSATALESGATVDAYEIHIGQTDGPDRAAAWLEVEGRPEGASDPTGRIKGCYLHGLFTSDAFRHAFLADLGAQHAGIENFDTLVEETLDALADHLETHLDLDGLLEMAEEIPNGPTLT